MSVDRESMTKWLLIGLVSVMALCLIVACLCIGTTYFVSDFISAIGDALESASEILPTPTDEATPIPTGETTPETTPTTQPTESTSEVDPAEQTLRLLSDIEVPVNDPIELAKRFRGLSDIPRVLVESADLIPVGSVQSFWAGDNDKNINFQVQAELVYATEHVYFWIEQGVKYDLNDVVALVDDFECQTYPTNRAFFGSEWTPGVDGDPHIYILYARNLGWSVAGYFGSNDEFSPLVHEYSNGHEMFYLSADNVKLWEAFAYTVLAHEFQHMIHWALDRNEDTWLDEGFADLAAHLNGHSTGGADYIFALDPDVTLYNWSYEGEESGGHYGQAFLFMAYFLDRFGSDATQALVANPINGLDSVDQTLESLGLVDDETGEPITADDVYQDWAAALLLMDATVGDGRYAFRSYEPPSPVSVDEFGNCPIGEQSREVSQYGIDYIRFHCRGDYTLIFDGQSSAPVVPTEPHGADFAFWTNRGNESDMTLTRAFDLREVEGPVNFDYWVWYDIEEGWDYVYLEVSTDGGETWQILNTPSGTDENPSGNSYGWAYTGYSGGRGAPAWILETVDLSDYAGQEVTLRFEYVTDAAVNGEGLLLDDLSIEALGYSEGFEMDDGRWEAEGFARLYNRLPQTYRLLLVELGSETRLTEITLDDSRHAEVRLNLGGAYDEAVLVVIGTARHTWQPAPYKYQVAP